MPEELDRPITNDLPLCKTPHPGERTTWNIHPPRYKLPPFLNAPIRLAFCMLAYQPNVQRKDQRLSSIHLASAESCRLTDKTLANWWRNSLNARSRLGSRTSSSQPGSNLGNCLIRRPPSIRVSTYLLRRNPNWVWQHIWFSSGKILWCPKMNTFHNVPWYGFFSSAFFCSLDKEVTVISWS